MNRIRFTMKKRLPSKVVGNESTGLPARPRFTARRLSKRELWHVTPPDPFDGRDVLIPGPLPCSLCGKRVPPRSQRVGRILCPNCREGGYLAGAHWRPVLVATAPIATKAPTPVRLTGRLAQRAAAVTEPEVDQRTKPDDSRLSRRMSKAQKSGNQLRKARPRRPLAPAELTSGSGRSGRPRKLGRGIAAALVAKREQARQLAERRADAPGCPAGFPPRQYEAWFLTRIEGSSLSEAGVRMGGISKVAVKHLVDKATQRGLTARPIIPP